MRSVCRHEGSAKEVVSRSVKMILRSTSILVQVVTGRFVHVLGCFSCIYSRDGGSHACNDKRLRTHYQLKSFRSTLPCTACSIMSCFVATCGKHDLRLRRHSYEKGKSIVPWRCPRRKNRTRGTTQARSWRASRWISASFRLRCRCRLRGRPTRWGSQHARGCRPKVGIHERVWSQKAEKEGGLSENERWEK